MKKLLLPTALITFTVIFANALPKGLVEKLDADEFATRSKAQKDLMKWAKDAKQDEIKELKKTYEATESPEVKMRLFDVLDSSTYMAEPNTRGFVGISMDARLGGVIILGTTANSPAQKVDLRVGDMIVGVDNIDLTKKKTNISEAMEFFRAYVQSKNSGQKLDLKVMRAGKIIDKTLKLANFDKFNPQFGFQNNQQFLLNGNRIQIQPNGNQFQIQPGGRQLRVVPQGARPRPNLNELKRERDLQMKMDPKKQKMKQLDLEDMQKKFKQLELQKKK